MSYELRFRQKALKEWNKLSKPVREQFRKKLRERLEEPRVEADRLRQVPDCYKIKLRSAGYRLVYEVRASEIVVSVVAIGRRDKSRVYKDVIQRLSSE
ncbi:addiction module RelE/StbE family toxin [Halospina denitrificans]|uniref:Addiction module RelE/StbE family toxin n=1 Tax=Halospina denitrificans TaxID=332522 RepID=A0A4R7JPW4_9GAMM|nr:type II toxin-antitoxin system RelE/ParE family toxin [Halospina denitrificans]TDT40212.1 addiction module RelE/StbE family toxin [Halospina denitrificans]